MITAWTEHLKDPEEKVKFEQGVLHARWLLERLDTLLDQLGDGLERQELTPRVYDEPNWHYRQAHANGFKQCLRKIKVLIDLDHKEKLNER